MGRRKKSNIDLPMYMAFKNGGYHFRRHGKSKLLSRDKKKAFTEYNKIMFPDDGESFTYFAYKYIESDHHTNKAKNSIRNDLISLKNTTYAFKEFVVPKIKPHHVKKYMTHRAIKSKNWANKDKSFISNVLQLAVDEGAINDNPCKQVKPLRVPKRKRLIIADEFKAIHDIAPYPLNHFMTLMFLLVERPSNILAIKLNDITEKGISIHNTKVDKHVIVSWSPELTKVIDNIKDNRRNRFNQYLFEQRRGHERYQLSALQSMFKRTMKKAIDSSLVAESFTLYDIRAYAITHIVNTEGYGVAAEKAGHNSEKMVRSVYFRGEHKKEPTR